MEDVILYDVSRYVNIRYKYLKLFHITKRINDKMNNGIDINQISFNILMEEDPTLFKKLTSAIRKNILNPSLKFYITTPPYDMCGCGCRDRGNCLCNTCGRPCCDECWWDNPHTMCYDCGAVYCKETDSHIKCTGCNVLYCKIAKM